LELLRRTHAWSSGKCPGSHVIRSAIACDPWDGRVQIRP
jgi:hypothetical protein